MPVNNISLISVLIVILKIIHLPIPINMELEIYTCQMVLGYVEFVHTPLFKCRS